MTPSDLVQRYRWFCLVGWKHPTLNDPLVIRGDATPEHIEWSGGPLNPFLLCLHEKQHDY